MANLVAKYAAKKMLSSQLQQYKDKNPAGPYDPYYEIRPNPRNGKPKKYKKQIPAYIPSHDADILARVRKTAYRLDCSLFTFLGVRFGVSSVIGLIPVIGDGVDAALALNTVRKCKKVDGGLPQGVLLTMLFWVFLDFIAGLVPFVGDLLDAGIKANSRCCRVLEEHLDNKYKPKEAVAEEKRRKEEARKSGVVYAPPAPATVYEDFSEDEERVPTSQSATNAQVPMQPAPVHNAYAERREEQRSGGKWYSGGGSKSKNSRSQRPVDVEAGYGSRH